MHYWKTTGLGAAAGFLGATILMVLVGSYDGVDQASSGAATVPSYISRLSRDRFVRALDAHGGPMCACCGEDSLLFLTIDHVNSDGAEHRRQVGGKSGKNLARWLGVHRYSEGFQVLCFNCSCGRARNGGVCPHRANNGARITE